MGYVYLIAMSQNKNPDAESTEETVKRILHPRGGVLVQTETKPHTFKKYGFIAVDQHDKIKGDVEDNAVVYTGKDSLAVHYSDGQLINNIPSQVIEALEDNGYEVIEGEEAGWINWNGRPEFSETYFKA